MNHCNYPLAGSESFFASYLQSAEIQCTELLCFNTCSEFQVLVFLWQWEYITEEEKSQLFLHYKMGFIRVLPFRARTAAYFRVERGE